ncbi:helix-turn-helix domain-containing protein [Curtobacterium sp. MCSS17_008]|uniref:helix-turn-helix domain-containing protein n=1 Tax=Curtobacterium sp. MCSS17_008 TaxID=2175647 RepID=UPI0015E8E078|nr:helix-turn-helix domain-containing protein [Curtobacterium sp. MCSS17_008]
MITATDVPPAEDQVAELRRTSVRDVRRSGSDPDEARALYEAVYDGRDLAFRPDGNRPFRYRYRSTGDGRVSLCTSSVSAHRTGVLAPERQYLLAWSVEGGVVVDPDREDGVTLRPGVPVMCPAGRPFTVTAPPGTVHLVRFDADFLEAVAVMGRSDAPMPLSFPIAVPSARLAPLQRVLREVAEPMLDVDVVAGERATLDLRVAEAVLEAFRPEPADGPPDGPVATLDRAKAYMYAHFARPLSAAEIAAAADVSVRTLQETFQRQEGTTPTAFLRDLRLDKARLALQLADARETSVSVVAHSCGFRHMGRFSGAYGEQYGEHPGETLRGQRRLIAVADGLDRPVPSPRLH